MRVHQTNGTDTATFDRQETISVFELTSESDAEINVTPLVEGGQGRTANSLTDTLQVCGWLMLAVVEIGAVVCGIGVINAVAGTLPAAIATLCCVVVGANAYGIGRAA